MKKNTLLFILVVILLSLTGYGCTKTDETETGTPEARLEKRVHELMTAKVNGDWKRVYSFFNEAYKSKVPETRFETARAAQFLDFKIEQIEMTDSKKTQARVIVKHNILFNSIAVEGTDPQDWVFEKNDWYLAAKPDSGF